MEGKLVRKKEIIILKTAYMVNVNMARTKMDASNRWEAILVETRIKRRTNGPTISIITIRATTTTITLLRTRLMLLAIITVLHMTTTTTSFISPRALLQHFPVCSL